MKRNIIIVSVDLVFFFFLVEEADVLFLNFFIEAYLLHTSTRMSYFTRVCVCVCVYRYVKKTRVFDSNQSRLA